MEGKGISVVTNDLSFYMTQELIKLFWLDFSVFSKYSSLVNVALNEEESPAVDEDNVNSNYVPSNQSEKDKKGNLN